MAPTFELTEANYFASDRKHISNSQVSDFFKSREYYWRKNVLREIEFSSTPAMRIGSLVDNMLCGKPLRYEVKVLKKDDPDLYEEQKDMPPDSFVTDREFTEAMNHAKSIMKEPVYKWYIDNKAQFQVLLTASHKRIKICGMADVITETKDRVYIDDFKVVSKMKVATLAKWHYNCLEFGYYRQLAAYKFMWAKMHPKDKREIVTRHLVSVKHQESLYKPVPIIIEPDMLELALEDFQYGVEGIAALKKNKDWHDEPVTWEDAETLYIL